MKLYMVAVYDSAAQAFIRPVFFPALGLAVRTFEDEVRRADPANPIHGHPSDFDLRVVAEFDDNSGAVTQAGVPTVLIRGKDVQRDAPQ